MKKLLTRNKVSVKLDHFYHIAFIVESCGFKLNQDGEEIQEEFESENNELEAQKNNRPNDIQQLI